MWLPPQTDDGVNFDLFTKKSTMQPTIYYCYDAYCGWCYGFSPVIQQLEENYRDRVAFDVLSGGMVLPEEPTHFSTMAGYIKDAYKQVEEMTGVTFGPDFLWHVNNPDETDWFPDSTKSAIALSIIKELHPERAVAFASDLQYALNFEGRDLTDDEAYRHLLPKYNIADEDFYAKLKSEEYREKAYYDMALVKQLQVSGFPTVLMQVSDAKFYLLGRGYADYDTMVARVEKVLAELV